MALGELVGAARLRLESALCRSRNGAGRDDYALGRGKLRATIVRVVPEERLEPMLGLTQLSNYLTLGSFSAVSKPNFVSKYALESSGYKLLVDTK